MVLQRGIYSSGVDLTGHHRLKEVYHGSNNYI